MTSSAALLPGILLAGLCACTGTGDPLSDEGIEPGDSTTESAGDSVVGDTGGSVADSASDSAGRDSDDGLDTAAPDSGSADTATPESGGSGCGVDTGEAPWSTPSGEFSATEARAELMGEEGDGLGAAASAGGDMDGDGLDDVVIGAPSWGSGGATIVVRGPVSGTCVATDAAAAIAYGGTDEAKAGGAISGGVDLDGDGWLDLAIGDMYASVGGTYGRGFVVYGPLSGTRSLDLADATIEDPDIWLLGYEVSLLPDLTGDGQGDLAISDSGATFEGVYYDYPTTWVLSGPLSGTLNLDDAIVISGEEALVGRDLDGIGDLNGDGLQELGVGSGGGGAGVYCEPLDGDTTLTDADWLLSDEGVHSLGVGVTGRGDVDADGYDDVLIGAMFASPSGEYSGAAYLYAGSATLPTTSDADGATAQVVGEDSYIYLSNAIDLDGDVDADGHDDVLVSGRGADGSRGVAILYYGPMGGSHLLSDADATFWGGDEGDLFGNSAIMAGDTNGDGYTDILVGALYDDDNGSFAGGAYLFTGR